VEWHHCYQDGEAQMSTVVFAFRVGAREVVSIRGYSIKEVNAGKVTEWLGALSTQVLELSGYDCSNDFRRVQQMAAKEIAVHSLVSGRIKFRVCSGLDF